MIHDKKKRLFHDPGSKRKELTDLLKKELLGYQDVTFAYLYGSFLEAVPYHDIDIGVCLAHISEKIRHDITLELSGNLSRKVGRPVDVHPLNSAPVGFMYHVFRGTLLLDRDEDLRVRLIERTIMFYLDMKPLLERSLKEAMTR